MNKKDLFPVYVFRPIPNWFKGEVRRYNDGHWKIDDGEYDLCFIGKTKNAPVCLYFSLPYYNNILWQWIHNNWREKNFNHPNYNACHIIFRRKPLVYGKEWGRDKHENTIAGERGIR